MPFSPELFWVKNYLFSDSSFESSAEIVKRDC